MKKIMTTMAVLVTTLAMTASSAWAHHSYAMFDDTKMVTVKGVVKELQWFNPHIWIEVDVPSGEHAGSWSFEGGTITILKRMGWTRDLVKAGETVTISARPLKNGKHGGSIQSVTLADGRVLPGAARSTNDKTDPNLVER